MDSPTSRSLAWLREQGFTAQKVEHWNQYARRTIDLFGVIDLVAIRAGIVGVTGIQTTTGPNVAARKDKCNQAEALKLWLQCGNHFEIHGWAKHGQRGERKTWGLRRIKLSLEPWPLWELLDPSDGSGRADSVPEGVRGTGDGGPG